MKSPQANKYIRGQQITYIREGAKSFNNEIKDYLTLTQLILYAKSSCQELEVGSNVKELL
jgi:hypothetical protein